MVTGEAQDMALLCQQEGQSNKVPKLWILIQILRYQVPEDREIPLRDLGVGIEDRKIQ